MTVHTVVSSTDPGFAWVDVVHPSTEESDRRFSSSSVLWIPRRPVDCSLVNEMTCKMAISLPSFSVFFLPLTFIVGVYGMNFEFMLELREQWGYPTCWQGWAWSLW